MAAEIDQRHIPAPNDRATRIRAQFKVELRFLLNRGENLLLSFLIPVVALLAFSRFADPPAGYARNSDFLMPGVMALALIATGMVTLGISTGYERHYHVLKRLATTPLERGDLLLAKTLAVFIVEILQLLALSSLAFVLLDWHVEASALLAIPCLLLGSLCFTGLGFLFAGILKAEANMAVTNVLFILVASLGGIFTPLERLPEALEVTASLLPAAALTAVLRSALPQGVPPEPADLIVLIVWSLVPAFVAGRTFNWD